MKLTPKGASTFNSSLKDTFSHSTIDLYMLSFNSSLKDTGWIWKTIIHTSFNFQFLIKGYAKRLAYLGLGNYTFQFLIKGYIGCTSQTCTHFSHFQFLIKGYLRPVATATCLPPGAFNSSLKDTYLWRWAVSGVWHFQFLIKGYRQYKRWVGFCHSFQFLIKGYKRENEGNAVLWCTFNSSLKDTVPDFLLARFGE